MLHIYKIQERTHVGSKTGLEKTAEIEPRKNLVAQR